jgi:RNA polymerase sigma-70 factor (ECF subfamily)
LDSINNARIDYISSIEGSKIIESHDFRKHIEAAINSLPEKCGEAFRLKYLYGMTNTDIAKAMNISVRTAEGHTYKALKELRRKLSHLLIILIFLHLTT